MRQKSLCEKEAKLAADMVKFHADEYEKALIEYGFMLGAKALLKYANINTYHAGVFGNRAVDIDHLEKYMNEDESFSPPLSDKELYYILHPKKFVLHMSHKDGNGHDIFPRLFNNKEKDLIYDVLAFVEPCKEWSFMEIEDCEK